MDAPLLSINIVSYNTKQITVDCLNSIQRSINLKWMTKKPREDIEIVIVDNCSKDGSTEAIEEYSKTSKIPIRLIKNAENTGFGRGHNKAAKESKGELLLLLNTDTILMKDALCTLVLEYLAKNPSDNPKYKNLVKDISYGLKTHFLGPKLLNSDFSAQPSCGPYYSIPVIIAALFMRGDYWRLTRYSPNENRQVDWISGAAMICKKSYFTELGGFDEEIFMYMEEIDLLFRARKKGMTVWFTPNSHIVHLGSASSNKQYPIYQVYKGFIYLYKKHHSKLSLSVVQSILSLKSHLVILLGKILKKPLLVQTYENSLKIVNGESSIN